MADAQPPAEPPPPTQSTFPELNIPPHLLDPDGRLAIDAACTACSYNLRTLLPTARCPECNTPVAETLGSARIVFYDPQWIDDFFAALNRLRTGAMFLAGSLFALIAFIPVGFIPSQLLLWLLIAVSILSPLVGIGVWLSGIWRLAALPPKPAPHVDYAPLSRALRRSVWWAVVALLAAAAYEMAFTEVQGGGVLVGLLILAALFAGVLSAGAFVARDLTKSKFVRRIKGQRDGLAVLIVAVLAMHLADRTGLWYGDTAEALIGLGAFLTVIGVIDGDLYLSKLQKAIRKDTGRT